MQSFSSDFNFIIENGYYGVSRSSDYGNAPTASFAGMLLVFNSKDNETAGISQYAYNVDLGVMYYRMKWAGVWQSWVRIDNFGCNTLAELKAALDAI